MHYSSCLCKGTRLLFSIFNVPNCQSKTGSPVTDTFAFQRHLGFAFPRIEVQKHFSPSWKSCSGAQCSSLPPLSRLSIEVGLNKITLPYSSSSFAKRRLSRFYIYVFVFVFFVFVSVFFLCFVLFLLPLQEQAWVLCSVLWNVNSRTCANNYHFPKPLPTPGIWRKTSGMHFSQFSRYEKTHLCHFLKCFPPAKGFRGNTNVRILDQATFGAGCKIWSVEDLEFWINILNWDKLRFAYFWIHLLQMPDITRKGKWNTF